MTITTMGSPSFVLLLIRFLVLTSVFLEPTDYFAQSCKCGPRVLTEHFEAADKVFLGNVTSVSENEIADKSKPYDSPLVVSLSVVKQWKGVQEDQSSTMKVWTMPLSASCGFCQFIEDCAGGYPTGKQFLVFARNVEREMPSTEKGGKDVVYAYVDGCGGSRDVDSELNGVSAYDLEELDALAAVATGVSVARIVADSEGSDVVNTDEVDSNDAECSTPDVLCILVYAPVKCENGCTYSNLCFALAADQLRCCPIPDKDISCPMIYDPITCADRCAYENDCFAEAAGFKLTTCPRDARSGSIGGFVVSLWTSVLVFVAVAKLTIM